MERLKVSRSKLRVWIVGGFLAGSTGVLQAQTLEQRIDRLERQANNPVLLQHTQRMNDHQREIQNLFDQIDRLNRKIEQLESKLTTQYQDTDQRLSQLEQKQQNTIEELTEAVVVPDQQPASPGVSQYGAVVPAETSPSLVMEQSVSSNNSQLEYDRAFGLLREAQYDQAIEAFKSYVTSYPQADLSSNAFYWLGEAYLIKQDYQSAFDAFNKVLIDYTQSNKIEDAMLRGADSLVGLNRLDDAKAMYQDLVQRFPESRAAKSAQTRLERFKTGE